MERLTKIVATLGPATSDPESIRALVRAGMDVARLNFSHGDHDLHRSLAGWVREAAEAEGRVVAVLQDVQGPKIRVGSFPEGSIGLQNGRDVLLRPGRSVSDQPDTVYIDYLHLLDDVRPGHRVLLADGLIRLEVTEVGSEAVTARVVQGGHLLPGKGVALPDTILQVPALTDKDHRDLVFGREIGVDYVAASFVRSGDDVRAVRELAGDASVIAKIELAAAYENLDDILAASDGAMVARGDLGVELPLEKIPGAQDRILSATNALGLVSITATEMLESMTHAPRPTRAEVTDVATAVAAGTDAVMLSAETAIGEFPIQTVETMARICIEAEARLLESDRRAVRFIGGIGPHVSAVARASVEVAHDLGISTIVAFTETGSTARLLSSYRPHARIIGFTAVPKTLAKMALFRGVHPVPFIRRDSTDLMIAAAEKHLEKSGLCERGETVVMVAGVPPNQEASTNLLKIHQIGERDRFSGRSRREPGDTDGFSR
jgi:pyruvate kinase